MFMKSNFLQIITVHRVGSVGNRVLKISTFLLEMAHPCKKPRRLSHFAWRSLEGSSL